MIVRFSEYEYYNINQDEDWVRFMATTSKGTYFTEVPRESSRIYRENKDKFKQKVMDYLTSNLDPCELNLEETLH